MTISWRNLGTVEVPGVPLGKLLDEHPSNVLRLDVEGYEYEILMDQIPECVEKLSMEFHTRLLGETRARRLLAYFEDIGFKVAHLVEDVPPRFYPFVYVLKNLDAFKFMCYVQDDLTVDEATEKVFRGRGLKYLFLERAGAR